MRVLYCSDTYPPQVNGVSVVTALSVAGLAARGWDCGVVAPRYPAGEGSVFGEGPTESDALLLSVPSVAFPKYPDVRLAAPQYGAIARIMRRFNPDLVHCETEFVIGRLGQLAARRAGFPVVSSYHTDFARYAEAYGVAWLRASISRYIARFHRRSRRTYTPSVHSRDDLIRMGVRDVEVWGRGVDTGTFSPARRSDALRQQMGVGERCWFLHVGRLAPEKRAGSVPGGPENEKYAGRVMDATKRAKSVANAKVLIRNYSTWKDPREVKVLGTDWRLPVKIGTLKLPGIINRSS